MELMPPEPADCGDGDHAVMRRGSLTDEDEEAARGSKKLLSAPALASAAGNGADVYSARL